MSNIPALANSARIRRRELDTLSGEARSVIIRVQGLQTEIETLTSQINTLEKSAVLLNSIGEERQFKAQVVIEELVTRGLQTIFDDTLSFHIIQTTKARTSNVDFVVRTTLTNGSVVDTPIMEARGGGLAATVGFLLRVVIMLLRDGSNQENLLVLDETFAHVSAEYLDGVGAFLREIVDKTSIQIVMVTHQPEFENYADRIYRFTAVEGKTVVQDV